MRSRRIGTGRYPMNVGHLLIFVSVLASTDFRVRVAILDHTVRGAFSPPHTASAPGFATQDHAQARDSNAAQSDTQDKEATLANLFGKECQGCGGGPKAKPPRPTASIFRSDGLQTPVDVGHVHRAKIRACNAGHGSAPRDTSDGSFRRA